jgi:hypothetical protein
VAHHDAFFVQAAGVLAPGFFQQFFQGVGEALAPLFQGDEGEAEGGAEFEGLVVGEVGA